MLTGITVVDFSRHLPGPICTMRLADLGAQVIEILPYPLDHALLSHFVPEPARETGAFTLRSHRNHKSVSLNLRTAEGKSLAFALARQADVVVESYRPGVLRHLGLDYDSVWAAHPAVIYCSVTNYGQNGELYQLSGHDLNIQAVSGFLSAVRDSEGKPVVADLPLADYAVGVYASEQICAALVQRARTGRGAYLDVASADLLTAWTGLHALLSKSSGAGQNTGAWSKDYVAYQIYETADGQYVALAAREEKFWRNFCRAVGRADWETMHTATISQHHDMYEELCTLFLTRTQAEWSELGVEVDCCLTAVEELENWACNGYAQSREIAYSLPYLERKEGGQASREHSWYTDHTHEILKKKLKVTQDSIRRLEDQGVIPVWPT
jgi:succinate---hydroxymethylglutarate CoA-transferase